MCIVCVCAFMANWSASQSIDSEKFNMQNWLEWEGDRGRQGEYVWHTDLLVVLAYIGVAWKKSPHTRYPYIRSILIRSDTFFLILFFSVSLSLSMSEWICVWCVLCLASYVLCHTSFEEAIKTTHTKHTHIKEWPFTCRFVDSGHKNRFEWLTYDIEFYIYKDIKLP